MPVTPVRPSRKRRLCYWDNQKNAAGATKMNLERYLSFLPDFNLDHLKSLDDENFAPCDLLIISAIDVPAEDFTQWLRGINKRIVRQNHIWTPALIFNPTDFVELSSDLHEFADNNWYFDILDPQHLESMPIRVANLLRIHDHLHELWRYREQLDAMQQQIELIERKLQSH